MTASFIPAAQAPVTTDKHLSKEQTITSLTDYIIQKIYNEKTAFTTYSHKSDVSEKWAHVTDIWMNLENDRNQNKS